MTAPRLIVVLAAIIERDGRVLLTRRLEGTHLAGLWEFPGGKCEPHETHEACLARELMEELGVACNVGEEVLTTEHAYSDRLIRLHFRRCVLLSEPQSMLGQQMQWVAKDALDTLAFPAADAEIVAWIKKTGSPR
jgi:mutator protein MutT